jgi:hypothetical protein
VGPTTNDLRGSKVDRESTKNIVMKQRRVVDAAPSQDDNDYIILAELKEVVETVSKNLTDAFTALLVSFKISWIYINKLVTSIIRPPKDDIFAINFTKADGQTVVMALDTINSRLGVAGGIFSNNADNNALPNSKFVRLQFDPTGFNNYYGDLVSYDGPNNLYLPLAIRGSIITLGAPGTTDKLAFYTDDATLAVVKQVLAAYSSNNQVAYTGLATGVGGSPYASVADLNNLRVAYNNLRVMCEDLRSKLQSSTLVG